MLSHAWKTEKLTFNWWLMHPSAYMCSPTQHLDYVREFKHSKWQLVMRVENLLYFCIQPVFVFCALGSIHVSIHVMALVAGSARLLKYRQLPFVTKNNIWFSHVTKGFQRYLLVTSIHDNLRSWPGFLENANYLKLSFNLLSQETCKTDI